MTYKNDINKIKEKISLTNDSMGKMDNSIPNVTESKESKKFVRKLTKEDPIQNKLENFIRNRKSIIEIKKDKPRLFIKSKTFIYNTIIDKHVSVAIKIERHLIKQKLTEFFNKRLSNIQIKNN